MMKVLRGTVFFAFFFAVLFVVVGCKKEDPTPKAPPGGGPGKFGPGSGIPPRKPGPIGEIMGKLTNGPESLTSVIGEELGTDPPPWDKLDPQAKEFAALAASMGKLEPPRGSKESWGKFTSAYSDTAATLNKAVQAKDKDAALAAHQILSTSCMACHKEHKGMGFGPAGSFGKSGPGKFGPPGGAKGPGGSAPPADGKPAPAPDKDKEKQP
jgi:hypothetical protein